MTEIVAAAGGIDSPGFALPAVPCSQESSPPESGPPKSGPPKSGPPESDR